MRKKCLIILSLLLILMGNTAVLAANGKVHGEEHLIESEAY